MDAWGDFVQKTQQKSIKQLIPNEKIVKVSEPLGEKSASNGFLFSSKSLNLN